MEAKIQLLYIFLLTLFPICILTNLVLGVLPFPGSFGPSLAMFPLCGVTGWILHILNSSLTKSNYK